jgi:hypothetical protein
MKTVACLFLTCTALACIGGCERNLSPEMKGLAMRPADAHNQFRMTANQNMRSASDDISRVWYTDAPSRLTPFPIVSTSGQPR